MRTDDKTPALRPMLGESASAALVRESPRFPMLCEFREEDLTHTEGALIEALRALRRVETCPDARAEYRAWNELRFVAADLDEDELDGYCEGHPQARLLAAASRAIRLYTAAKVQWLADHPVGLSGN